MLPGPVYLLSDAHIGAAPRETEEQLLAFLREFPTDAGALVINGDLFDFWFEWRHVVPRAAIRVLGALATLRARGLPILWIAGNHDCWGGKVVREDLGIDFHVGPWEGSLAGWRTVIEHGDGLRPQADAPYRRLRTVLRHPLSVTLYRWLHPDWGTALALRSSHTSRNMRPGDGGAGLLAVATQRLEAPSAPELLVFGHSHVAHLGPIGSGIYANPGAWLDRAQYLRISATEIAAWELDGEGPTLRAAVRRQDG